MNKNVKYLATILAILMPILTVLVWVAWVLLRPSFRDRFLDKVSKKVEGNILKDPKRRSNSLRKANA
jgi:hypothetical protein